ncbi:MAG: hypothetical protein LBL61_01790 [Elusimicrobiota bacterium]|jgi:hypothetical protein|nr:hypothetical protein [Elusimicrobiota bacterium]
MKDNIKKYSKLITRALIKAAVIVAAVLLILWWIYPDIFCIAARPDCSGAEQNNIYNAFCRARYNCPADTIPL